MSTTMNALDSKSIRTAEFVRLTTVNQGEIAMSNLPYTTVIEGISFNTLGSLLQISNIQRDLKSTSNDISISFTGIDPNAVAIILDAKVKGSKVEIWRGFFDSNYQIITSPNLQFFSRFVGFVTNVSITEEFSPELDSRVATATVSCSSFRSVLENSQSGIRTNPNFWKMKYPSDSSFDRVPLIENTAFDFGKPPTKGGNADSSNGAGTTSDTYVSGSEGGL